MDSNRCSHEHGGQPPANPRNSLAALAAVADELAAQDRDRLADAALADQVLRLRRLLDRLEGHWLGDLAALDGRGAAGADQGTQAASTASWLRNRLHMGATAASSAVRTARALFRGPLTRTAQALCDGDISTAHASALAHGTHDLPTQTAAKAEPVLVEAARRLDPPQLRRLVGHLQQATDPDAADAQAQRRHGRRGLWVAPTLDGMVALGGLLDPEAGKLPLPQLPTGPTVPGNCMGPNSHGHRARRVPGARAPGATSRGRTRRGRRRWAGTCRCPWVGACGAGRRGPWPR
jgi:hypothetical protein